MDGPVPPTVSLLLSHSLYGSEYTTVINKSWQAEATHDASQCHLVECVCMHAGKAEQAVCGVGGSGGEEGGRVCMMIID